MYMYIYTHIYIWITLLYIWNQHNIVNQLHLNFLKILILEEEWGAIV